MKTSIPRLASVKMKTGGAKLHVLRNTVAEDCVRVFNSDCCKIAQDNSENLVGFAIVAWRADGGVATSVRVRDGHVVGRMMVPDFVRSALIDHLAGS